MTATPLSTALVRAYALGHPAFVLTCFYLVSRTAYTGFELAGIILSAGFLGGAAFNVGHELCHRRNRVDGALATIALCSVSYPTFKIEHIGHHHKWAATAADPSSAGRGA